ncbi:flavin reductase family protein [Streptomyces erythrochromogenes]|uniref:flavin reductase family protein n=1 Tax=Streptomyces erythrochromogenes TaxID=285574 RepID=UPI003676B250
MATTLGPARPVPRSASAPPDDLRAVMRLFPTGVTVLSSGRGDRAAAMTANSFVSISLDPPRVLVSVMKSSRTYPAIDSSGELQVHLLSDRQGDVARLFASRDKPFGRDLEGHFSTDGEGSHPYLPGALASLGCRIEERFPGGDHTLFLARVEHVRPGEDTGGALLFHRGRLTPAPAAAG